MTTGLMERGAPPRSLDDAPAGIGRSVGACSVLLSADTLNDVSTQLTRCWIDGDSPVVCVTDPTGLPRDWLRKVSAYHTVILGPRATSQLLEEPEWIEVELAALR